MTMATIETESLWPQIEPLLARVERPSRYIDHEFNRLSKPDALYQAVYVYPDTYEIGQSNQAIALLYEITNRITEVSAERAYLPWLDMIALLREAQIPLFSLESCRALSDFDLLGITIPHELAVTNILEVLDLAGLPLRSSQRDLRFPLVIGGGPGCFNPEPLAPFFDLIAIGESEELIGELIAEHRRLMAAGVGKAQMLDELAAIEGVYVPSLYDQNDASLVLGEGAGSVGSNASSRADADINQRPKVRRRVYMGFSQNLPDCNLVPFTEVTHDRLTIEVLRGCSRGCRFCQAGMTYRPVRERSSDAIVAAVTSGIAQTGFDEVSLVSLSTTDHSHIESILRRLNERYRNTGVSISLPSQRLDAFGVQMAKLVSGEKKSGLTFAPEAGSQRLRDVINKNVSEDDLFSSVKAAYSAGWRRSKLYFMIGLPSETDADIQAIADLVNQAYNLAKDSVADNQRSQVRMTVSVAVFVPKAQTPFQWQGQLPLEEIQRRIELLRQAGLHKGVDLNWHDPRVSQVEAALSRAGREAAQLIEAAWRHGALFAAWSERFDYQQWQAAAVDAGLDLAELAERSYPHETLLPWEHIDSGVTREYLLQELERAREGLTTPDCSFTSCQDCGVCEGSIQLDVEVSRHE